MVALLCLYHGLRRKAVKISIPAYSEMCDAIISDMTLYCFYQKRQKFTRSITMTYKETARQDRSPLADMLLCVAIQNRVSIIY